MAERSCCFFVKTDSRLIGIYALGSRGIWDMEVRRVVVAKLDSVSMEERKASPYGLQ